MKSKDQQLKPLTKAIWEVTGRRVDESTAFRWAQKGCSGIRMDTWMVGNRRYTNRDAVRRFIQERTQATTPPIASNASRTISRRERDADRADRKLREALS